ncbi:MAG: tetratricopeptide repeat protein [Pirellulaceae bacterium]|jgi:tetratricopeptide (TPR) repeat protein
MVNQDRIKRKQLIREAEGYLDLMSVFEDRWKLEPHLAEVMAERVLVTLSQIENPQGFQPEILFLKGQAHRAIGRFNEAAGLLEQSRRLDPENVSTILALAWCYKRLNRLGMAIEIMREAVLIDTESAIAHYNLACYLALDAHLKDAVHHLAIALEIDPKYRKLVTSETDFDSIRNTKEFQAALSINV